MKKVKLKLKLFFLPYILVNTVFLLLYTITIWDLYIRNGNIHNIDNGIVFYLVPGIIALALYSIFLTPRLRFAVFARSNTFGMLFFTMFAAFTTMLTSVAINSYIKDLNTPIMHLKNLSQVENQKLSGFYSFDNLEIDKSRITNIWGTSGKSGNKLYIQLIAGCIDSASSKYNFWILENRDSFLGKTTTAQYAYSQLLPELSNYLDTVNYKNVFYFERSVRLEKTVNIVEMIDRLKTNERQNIVLKPMTKPFVKRLEKDKLLALLAYFGFNLLWIIVLTSIGVSTLKLYDHERKKQLRH